MGPIDAGKFSAFMLYLSVQVMTMIDKRRRSCALQCLLVPLIAATYQATPDSCQCTEAACRICERHKGHAAVVDHNLETLMCSNLQQQQQQQCTPGTGSVVLEQERLNKQGRKKGCDGRGNKSTTQPQQHATEAM